MRHHSWFGIMVVLSCATCGLAQNRVFTVKDSIGMAVFNEPAADEKNPKILESPDGKYLLVVTTRGLISTNEVESRIWLFDNRAILAFLNAEGKKGLPPSARLLAQLTGVPDPSATAPYSPLVMDARWTADSRHVYFLGTNSVGLHRLCRIERKTGVLVTLTPPNQNVEQYRFNDDVIVYQARSADPDLRDPEGSKNKLLPSMPTAVTGLPLRNILFPAEAEVITPKVHELWAIRNGRSRKVPTPASTLEQRDMNAMASVIEISPDSRQVVQIRPIVSTLPKSWEAYSPLAGYEAFRIRSADPAATSPFNYFRTRQYVVSDLRTGRTIPLINAPYAEQLAYAEPARAIWGHDGKRLLVTNTLLPLDVPDPVERAKREHACTVASVELPSREAHCVVFNREAVVPTIERPKPLWLRDVSFGQSENEVVVRLSSPDHSTKQTERYEYSDGRWVLTGSDSSDFDDNPSQEANAQRLNLVSVLIHQSLNDPPVLWATSASNPTGREIWNPNPQFASIKFEGVSVYHWKDKTGHEWTGGLVKPIGYVPGRRYPLVIQTHGFMDWTFMTDGNFPVGAAARPLASAGIVVLQIYESWEHIGQLQEVKDNILGYQSAIESLASEGIIDPTRVGLTGFSRTCWYVESALIEFPNLFAAASISDGVDFSYMQSMLEDTGQSPFLGIYGSQPYGGGLATWLRLAPTFHLDKVRAPLMVTAIGPESLLLEWEIYSSLSQQRKPVELLYIPDDQHILQKPLSRLASQQGAVDWFRFWLQGYERPDPEDPDQYKRWEHLKELRDAEDKATAGQPPAPTTPPN